MADAFATAQQDVEAQRRAANAAIAAGGSAGAAAFQQGQQQIDAARTAALNAALSDAAQRGQGDIGGLLSGIVSRPYQQLGAGLASSAASHAADSAFTGAAADNYFRQLGSAIPVSAQSLQASIAREKAKAAQSLSDSELRTRLMGAGELALNDSLSGITGGHHAAQVKVMGAKQGLAQNAAALAQVNQRLAKRKNGTKPIGNLSSQRQLLLAQRAQLEDQLAAARKERAPFTEQMNALRAPGGRDQAIAELARQAGLDQGYEPARITGLIRTPTAPKASGYAAQPSIDTAARQAGINAKTLARITKPSGPNEATTHWEAIQSNAADYLKRGVPWDTFYRDMKRGLKGHPRTLKLAAAYWAPIFQAHSG